MKILRHEARPARAKPVLELPKTEPVAAPAEEVFTACELDAAEQLLHLSESSSSSGAPRSGGRALAATRSSSSSSSPRSVNTPAALAAAVLFGGCADWEEDGKHEVAGNQRRVNRYRLIAEICVETEEIGWRGGSSCRKNKKEQATR